MNVVCSVARVAPTTTAIPTITETATAILTITEMATSTRTVRSAVEKMARQATGKMDGLRRNSRRRLSACRRRDTILRCDFPPELSLGA